MISQQAKAIKEKLFQQQDLDYLLNMPLENSQQVYFWLIEQGYRSEQIIFGGDSSGCGLALALMLKLKDEGNPLPTAVFLISPMLDYTLSGSTIKTCAQLDPMIFEQDLQMTVDYYCGTAAPECSYISPVFGEYQGFPPMLIQVGSDEILLDDSIRLERKGKEAGVTIQLDIWEGMWHVFHSKIGQIPEAEMALKKIGQFINKVLNE